MNYSENIRGVYEHYKGGRYFVLRTAKSCDNPEIDYVIYESTETGEWYAREKKEFFQVIVGKKQAGPDGAYYTVNIPKFRKVY
jgi:hypothetical protein